MSKGDPSKYQQSGIQDHDARMQGNQNQLMGTLYGQNNTFMNNYNRLFNPSGMQRPQQMNSMPMKGMQPGTLPIQYMGGPSSGSTNPGFRNPIANTGPQYSLGGTQPQSGGMSPQGGMNTSSFLFPRIPPNEIVDVEGKNPGNVPTILPPLTDDSSGLNDLIYGRGRSDQGGGSGDSPRSSSAIPWWKKLLNAGIPGQLGVDDFGHNNATYGSTGVQGLNNNSGGNWNYGMQDQGMQEQDPAAFNFESGALSSSRSGYGDFAQTGGFSPSDLSNMRARAISPTRSIYSNAMDEVNRGANLSGGYSPNRNATLAKMAREQSYGIGNADINAEAGIAGMRQQGRLAGLGGLANIDSAEMANNQQNNANRLRAIDIFGGQALASGGQLIGAGNNQNQLSDALLRALYGGQGNPQTNWGQIAAGVGTGIAGYYASDENLKEDITPLHGRSVLKQLKKLPISKWKYKNDSTTHIGPMAQDFKKHFGVGDGKSIFIGDVMGVLTAATKEMANAN